MDSQGQFVGVVTQDGMSVEVWEVAALPPATVDITPDEQLMLPVEP